MSDHTPSPWRQTWTMAVAADGSPIADCEVRRSAQPDGGDHALDREIESNARLIAAAPELLEALESLAEEAAPLLPTGSYELKQANAAIAKARGRDD